MVPDAGFAQINQSRVGVYDVVPEDRGAEEGALLGRHVRIELLANIRQPVCDLGLGSGERVAHRRMLGAVLLEHARDPKRSPRIGVAQLVLEHRLLVPVVLRERLAQLGECADELFSDGFPLGEAFAERDGGRHDLAQPLVLPEELGPGFTRLHEEKGSKPRARRDGTCRAQSGPMPTSEILDTLTRIARDLIPLAIAWHVAILAVIAALLLGWRPSRRLAGMMFAPPALSVALVAALYGNPVNSALFGGLALALVVVGRHLPPVPLSKAPRWASIVGGAMIAFGWVYPHFLEAGSPWRYLYAAPTGLLPCPTLSVIIGFALLADGLGSRALLTLLGLYGLFYSVFGLLSLGVGLDAGLFFGAMVCVAGLRGPTPRVRGIARPV